MQRDLNVAPGDDVTTRELDELIARISRFGGWIVFDATRPDRTHRKLMDSWRVRGLGWSPEVSLDDGLAWAYEDFQAMVSMSSVHVHES